MQPRTLVVLSAVLTFLVLSFVSAMPSVASTVSAYPVSHTLTMPLNRQEQSQWCWAASVKSMVGYKGVTTTQCDVVKKVYGTSCPNVPAYDSEVQKALNGYRFASTIANAALEMGTVMDEVYAYNRPIYAHWVWDTGGGHAVVIHGYSTGVPNYIKYMDPSDGGAYWNSIDWVKQGGGHRWISTIYRLTRY